MSFNKYQRVSKRLQVKVAAQEKSAIIGDLAALARQLGGAFAAAGQSPGRPASQSFSDPVDIASNFADRIYGQGQGDPGKFMQSAMTSIKDEGALRQNAFQNEMNILQMEQNQAQNSLQNAMGVKHLGLDTERAVRDAEAHGWSGDRAKRDIEAHGWAGARGGREAERHGLEMQRLQNELAPGDWLNAKTMFGSDSNFQGSLGSTIGGGIGEMIASPMTGIAKGVNTAFAAPGTTFGYRLDKMLNNGMGGLMNRIKAPDIAAERFIESAAGNMADKATDLLADMTSKAFSSLTDAMVDSPARKAVLDQLRKEDNIISQMGEQELMDAYHSIAKYAPTLATDKNAVRSALRQAAQFEGGLDYMTIKGLAEAEAAVTQKQRPR